MTVGPMLTLGREYLGGVGGEASMPDELGRSQ
jgi:hypothetical protein